MRSLLLGGTSAAAVTFGNSCSPGAPTSFVNSSDANAGKIRFACTLYSAGVNVNNQGTSRTLQFRKNNANANVVVSFTNSTAGEFYDTSHTDSLSAGDRFDIQSNGTAPAYTIKQWIAAIETSGNNSSLWVFPSNGIGGSSATCVFMLGSYTATSGASVSTASLQGKVRSPGTARNLSVGVSSNSVASGSTTYKLAKNGTVTALAVSVASNTTGVFEDTSDTVSFADGDFANLEFKNGSSTGTIVYHGPMVEFLNDNPKFDLWGGGSVNNFTASGSDRFSGLGYVDALSSTESDWTIKFLIAATTAKYRAYVDFNTLTSAATLQLRKNSANASQSLSITNGVTGWFEDASNTDFFGIDDTISIKWSGGTSGSVGFSHHVLTVTPAGGLRFAPTGVDGIRDGPLFIDPLS